MFLAKKKISKGSKKNRPKHIRFLKLTLRKCTVPYFPCRHNLCECVPSSVAALGQLVLKQGESGRPHLQVVQLKTEFADSRVLFTRLALIFLFLQSEYLSNIEANCSLTDLSDLKGIAGCTFFHMANI